MNTAVFVDVKEHDMNTANRKMSRHKTSQKRRGNGRFLAFASFRVVLFGRVVDFDGAPFFVFLTVVFVACGSYSKGDF